MPCLLGLLTTENNMMFDLENGWCPIRKGYLTEELYEIIFFMITNLCQPKCEYCTNRDNSPPDL